MPQQKLTQTFVDTVQPQQKKVDYFDSLQTGLLLKVLPSGKKTYYLRYRDDRGKMRERKLADATILSLKDARTLARQKLAQIALGEDPFAKQAALRDVPRFAEFVAQEYLPYAKQRKRSWRTDVSLLNNHILPALGQLYMDEVSKRHLMRLFAEHRASHKPGSTNRIIILCRFIFNCAIRWEVPGVTSNPTAGIDLYPENNQIERFLTEAEAKRLFEALERSGSKMLKYIVGMLLLTGARKNEVLHAKWQDFDLKRRIWRIEQNKSGKTRHVPLSDGAIALLAQVPRIEGCEYVFANPDTGRPYTQIFYAWDTARKRAGLDDLRIHDLRHSFASFLVNSGRSLYEVQKILGHTQIKTTQRYAHLSQDSFVSAANCAAKAVPIAQSMPESLEGVQLVGVSY